MLVQNFAVIYKSNFFFLIFSMHKLNLIIVKEIKGTNISK